MIIRKFPFTPNESFTLDLPDVYRVVRITVEYTYSPRIFVLFDDKAAKHKKKFESFRDSVEIDPAHVYVGSYDINLFTYHLFHIRTT